MNGPVQFTDHNREGPKTPQLPQTGWEINTGGPPAGIINRFDHNDRGIIGDDVSSWPTDASIIFVPHRATIRSPRVPANRYGIPSIDDTAYIPAFAVGDPR